MNADMTAIAIGNLFQQNRIFCCEVSYFAQVLFFLISYCAEVRFFSFRDLEFCAVKVINEFSIIIYKAFTSFGVLRDFSVSYRRKLDLY